MTGENLFYDEGRWVSGVYIPAYARRYPFCMAKVNLNSVEQQNRLICIEKTRIDEGGDHEVLQWIRERRVDVGFVVLPDERYDTVPLVEDQMMALVPRSHPLAQLPASVLTNGMQGERSTSGDGDHVRELLHTYPTTYARCCAQYPTVAREHHLRGAPKIQDYVFVQRVPL